MICSVRDVPIYYEVYGEGRPLICIHGWSVDHRVMRGCMEPVFNQIPGYRRIYFDLPAIQGHMNCLPDFPGQPLPYWIAPDTIFKLTMHRFLTRWLRTGWEEWNWADCEQHVLLAFLQTV